MVLLSFSMLKAQQTGNWYFGSAGGNVNTGIRINWTSGTPVVTTCIPLRTEEGSSSISDASGNPLFYTDGVTVWDGATNAVLTGGTGLGGASSSTQSAIIMPRPSIANQWIIITSSTSGAKNYYIVTGTSATAGPFTVSAGTALTGGSYGEGVFVIGNSATGGFWIIGRNQGSTGQVSAWEVGATGLIATPNTPVVSIMSGPSGFTNTNNDQILGTIKSNTCQNKLAFTYFKDRVDVVGFNAATGQVLADAVAFSVVSQSYGIEFSSNDLYLYATSLNSGNVYQYVLSTNTLSIIGSSSPQEAGQLQTAPNGLIYCAESDAVITATPVASFLGVINAPNTAGASYVTNSLSVAIPNTCGIGNSFSYRGLPTFPKSLVVSNPIISPADATYCVNTVIPLTFTFGGSINASGVTWTHTGTGGSFSPGGATSTNLSPSITFTTTGIKTVTLSFTDACGRPYTATRTYTIVNVSTTTGTITCSQPSSIVLTSPDPNAIWYDAAVGGNILGVGSPVTLNYGSNGTSPSTVWVIPGTSVSSATTGTNVIVGPAPSWLNGSSYVYSTQFNVLSDQGKLNSFVIEPRPWPVACPAFISLSFTIEIRNSSSVLIYSLPYVAPAGTYSCGSPITIPVGADLPRGNGYTISLAGFTSNASSWFQIFNGFPVTVANVASNTGPTSNYTIMGNLNFTSKNFTVTTGCATRTAVNKACTLPVEWLGITAQRAASHVVVKWSVASELNNERYEVQRSLDGINFTTVGIVPGKGTYSAYAEYEFADYTAEKGTLYYRVVQYDYNGQSTQSKVVKADQAFGSLNTMVLYPNPTNGQFVITLTSNEEFTGVALVKVFNMLGQEIDTTTVDASVLSTGLSLDASSYPQGSYLVKVTTNEGDLIQHLIKR